MTPASFRTALTAAGLAVALVVGACDGDDDDSTVAPPVTTSTSAGAGSTTTSAPTAPTASTTPPTTPDGQLIAPWVTNGRLDQKAVEGDIVAAWKDAANQATCRLIVPADLGPELAGATLTVESIADDEGWQYLWSKGPARLQVIGLFPKTDPPRAAPYSKRWADGSVVRYGPEVGDEPAEGIDPETTANEAALRLPEQECEYRIYDTLGKSHLERVIDQVRLVDGD